MPFLQPKLSLKVSQRQILTPGLMQMVSVLALNKLELKEMINAEIVENPVLEEVEEHVPLLDDVAGREAERERPAEQIVAVADNSPEERDPFEEIDFGSYFQDYLDPGFRTGNNFESYDDKPSFENFLSVPQKLADHLIWQLGSLNLTPALREAAEYIVGNLNEDGYLIAGDAELLDGFFGEGTAAKTGLTEAVHPPENGPLESVGGLGVVDGAGSKSTENGALPVPKDPEPGPRTLLEEALTIVRGLDPVGVGAATLRECLLLQVAERRREYELIYAVHPARDEANAPMRLQTACFDAAALIIRDHLSLLQKRDTRELSKITNCPVSDLQAAIELIRTLDPKPGQRFNRTSTRLIEPDVAFVKRGDEISIVLNEEDIPTLRLNHGYKKLLTQAGTEKDVKDYVKERYRAALMLMRNIEQRKSTILKTCEAILRRQPDFLEHGVESLRPMMIKDVAEEIGVHPSTVSRAVSNKYVHTAQGVYELRFFFTEGVNGPEGAGTPLMLLKRKVKKLIEDEDPKKPLTDDQIALVLRGQGIRVTRRTVAKYREDLNIPSTHQRRVRA